MKNFLSVTAGIVRCPFHTGMKTFFSTTAIGLLLFCTGCSRSDSPDRETLNCQAFCFYYNWYGNTEKDGREIHWAHPVLKQSDEDTVTRGTIPGGDDIASNFFPQLGAYSCTDSATVDRHMRMLTQARIGVIVLTWWDVHDFGYQSVPLIMDLAARHGVKVCFHIEPFAGRNAETVRRNIQTIVDSYGCHPAFYRNGGKPLFFIYDSYLTPPEEWDTLLLPDGSITIRNTPYDALMIGLWVKEGEEDFFARSGFDGFYTYFGATAFTYGSTPAHWPYLQKWAKQHGKLFIPSVAPGYIDTRVRPWNGRTSRDRENGRYYDRMFEAAIHSGVTHIGITSFNEWHEGTQIEPAVPFHPAAFHYLDYEPLQPDYYLDRTAYWLERWEEAR
ncbi:MAG: alpha-mannosidase [Tannerella sp.]|jgi:glycoprotein endo-alpha-1,2-mannosidase|nr:alpha-mannosidase [Tannerella sp.]